MDHPIFKLEKVVQPKTGETLEDFEGPLDLILFLLNKNKIEIQDIPIALILDQYLAYLEQRKQMDLEVASEFVTMAAHLMYIKTRMLLSIEDEEAQSEMDALIQSLAERQRGDAYARIRKLTERMGPMSEFGRSILTRGPEPMKRGKVYEYDQEPGDLVIAMQEVLDRRGQAETPSLGAVSGGAEGQGVGGAAEKERHHPVFAAVPWQPQPQRVGGYIHGGAGAVPEPYHPVGGLCRRLHGDLSGGGGGMSVETREMKEIEAAVEGILFASGEPVHIDRICLAAELDRPTAELVLQKLMDYYSFERRGMRLLRLEDSWQLCSAPEYADVIRRAFEIRKPAKLSQPALEVLTIIAYYQPTTRAYVDQIRGVDSSYTVGLLLDRHLIEECGRLQVPGRPRLYRTTKAFLRAFHLNSLEDLPEMPGMEADGQLRLAEDGSVLDDANA